MKRTCFFGRWRRPHGPAAVLAGCLAAATATAQVRTIDGSANNPAHPTWGATATLLGRAMDPAYADGVSAMSGQDRPGPREISNAVLHQDSMGGVFIGDPRGLTDFIWAWGQFLDHDIDLTPEAGEEVEIEAPVGDPWFDPDGEGGVTLPFRRSISDPATGTDPSNPREQINMITTWIDASNVYGSDQTRADALRTFVDGKLKTSNHPTGPLPPFNTPGLENAPSDAPNFFLAGDIRANETLSLLTLHTLFVREHNRLADEIKSANPGWTDEQIYQRARKIVGAELQAITYNEYLPALLGAGAISEYDGYDAQTAPAPHIMSEFSTAAFRLGHTQVSSILLRVGTSEEGAPLPSVGLFESYFSPQRIHDEGGVEPLLRGFAESQAQRVDARIIDDLRNLLFGTIGPPMDLASLNIQRGRDHGLADFNSVRQAYGLAPYASLEDISSDPAVDDALTSIYPDISRLDPWVGMIAEDRMAGSSVGETIFTIVQEQFLRMRDADRFWYENDPELSGMLNQLNDLRLSDVVLRNTSILPSEIQPNLFQLPCAPDLDGDLIVDAADLGLLLKEWSAEGGVSDLNEDGRVDGVDLGIMLLAWGDCF